MKLHNVNVKRSGSTYLWVMFFLWFLFSFNVQSIKAYGAISSISAIISPGTAVSTTKITPTPYQKGDTFWIVVKSTATASSPVMGTALPAAAQAYTGGSNISGIDATTNKYIDLYEADISKGIVAFREFTVTSALIAVPGFSGTGSAVISQGLASGSIKLALIPVVAGDSFRVQLSANAATSLAGIGTTAPGSAYISGADLTGADPAVHRFVDIYEVNASGRAVAFNELALDPTNITAPLIKTGSISAGATAATTKAMLTPNQLGDGFYYLVGNASASSIPAYGTALPAGAAIYPSGSDISGVSATGSKYLDFYETDVNGKVTAFKEFIVAAGQIAAPAISAAQNVTNGSVGGSIKLTLAPNTAGDSFKVIVSAKAIQSIPAAASVVAGTAYVPLSDLPGVDPFTSKYVDIYEVNSSGKLTAFSEWIIDPANITAPAIKSGTAVLGSSATSTNITLTPNQAGDTFKMVSGNSSIAAIPTFGTAAPGTSYVSGSDISGLDPASNKYVDIFEVNVNNKITAFKEFVLSASQITAAGMVSPKVDPGSSAGSLTLTLTPNTPGDTFKVSVNSKPSAWPAINSIAPGTAFSSGTDLSGVDPFVNKYIDIYEIDGTGKTKAFSEVVADSNTIPATGIKKLTASAGSIALTTKLALTPNQAGDTFRYAISNLPITDVSRGGVPKSGTSLPGGTLAYISGDNILGVDTATNKYLDVFEINSNNRITAFSELVLTGNQVAVPVVATPTVNPGSVPSSIALGLTPGVGNHFIVKVVSKLGTAIPAIGDAVSGTTYVPGDDLTGVDGTVNRYVDIYEVNAVSKAAAFTEIVIDPLSITVPAIKTGALSVGTQPLGTKLILTPNQKGDSFKYSLGNSGIATLPMSGSTVLAGTTAYVSGGNIPGTDAVNKKYIDIYEVDGNDKVVAFKEFVVTTGVIAAPDYTTSPTAVPGAVASSIKLALTVNAAGDTFIVKTGSKAISALPAAGDAVVGTAYTSGADITGVDHILNRYVDIYEVDGNSKVVAFEELVVAPDEVAAPVIKSAAAAVGTAPQSTKVTLTPNQAGDSFFYKLSNASAAIPAYNSVLAGATAIASGGNIGGVDATTKKYVDLYEVDGFNKIIAFKEIVLTSAQISASDFLATPTAAVGGTAGSTKLTLHANNPADTFIVKIGTKPLTTWPSLDTVVTGSAYISDTDLTGVDPVTNKYIDIFEVDASGKAVAFKELPVSAGSVNAPLLKSGTASAGNLPQSTKLTLTQNQTGDTFLYAVGSSAASVPVFGVTAPNGTSPYASGSSITPVDAATKKYVDIYEVDLNNRITAFKEFTLSSSQISVPMIAVPGVAAGASAGSTKLSLTLVNPTDTFVVKISNKASAALPAAGDAITGTVYVSGTDLSGVDPSTNKFIDIYEVDGSSKAVAFYEVELTSAGVAAPTLKISSVSGGTIPGSTKAMIVLNQTGDLLKYAISDTPVGSAPVFGTVPPSAIPTHSTDAIPYTSGANIPGVDTVNKKYIDFYETNLSGKITAFTEITVASGQIGVQDFTTAPTVQPGTASGSVLLNVTAYNSSDTFKILVGSKPVASVPAAGATAAGKSYTPGTNITGVDPLTNKYIDVYEVDDNGKTVAFTEVVVDTMAITAPAIKSVTASPGTTAKSTKLTIQPNQTGDTIRYVTSATPLAGIPTVGLSLPSGTALYVSGSNIQGVDSVSNKYIDLYEVNLSNKITAFTEYAVIAGQIAAPVIATPSITPGSVAGSVKVAITANSPGDLFKVVVSSKAATTLPNIGGAASGTSYKSGNNLLGVDPVKNKYIDIYEVNASGKVVAFVEAVTTAGQITAPTIKTAAASSGTAAQTTKLVMTLNQPSDSFKVVVLSSVLGSIPTIGADPPPGAAYYSSGSNISNVDRITNKYLDVYEVDFNNKITAFKEFTLNATQLAAPPLAALPTVTSGTGAGSIKLALSYQYAGDGFVISVSSSPSTSIPAVGDSAAGIAYVPGTDLVGVDPASNRYIDIYEVDYSGKVMAFSEIVAASGVMTAPEIKTVSAAAGASPQSTRLTAVPNQAGDYLKYIINSSSQSGIPLVGSVPPSGILTYAAASDITNVDRVTMKYLDVYETDVNGKITAFKEIVLGAGQIAVPLLGHTPGVTTGSVAGSIRLSLTVNNGGDDFIVTTGSKPAGTLMATGTSVKGSLYLSGTDLTGIDPITNKYVDVYEVDYAGRAMAFYEFIVYAGNITAPEISMDAPAAGTATSSIVMNPKTLLTGDTYAYAIRATALSPLPAVGVIPTGTTAYVPGTDLLGADGVTNKFVDLYELDLNGRVVAFSEFELAPSQIAAPLVTVAAVAPGRTGGSVQLTLTLPANASSDSFVVNISSKPIAGVPVVGSSAVGSAYVSGTDLTGVDPVLDKYVDIYQVSVTGTVTGFTEIVLTSSQISAPGIQ